MQGVARARSGALHSAARAPERPAAGAIAGVARALDGHGRTASELNHVPNTYTGMYIYTSFSHIPIPIYILSTYSMTYL